MPTVLVYRKGDIVSQLVTLDAFGGSSVTEADVEWRLQQAGALEGCELLEDPRVTEADAEADAADHRSTVHINRIGVKLGRQLDDLSDDDDSWG